MVKYIKNIMESKGSIDLDLSNYVFAVKRRWVPAVSIFAGTVALSLIAAALMKPSYQAEGRLLFKNPAFKVIGSSVAPNNMEGREAGDLKPLVATQNPITTQMEVLTSQPLLQKLIEQLELKNDKGKPIKVSDLKPAFTTKIVGGSDVLQVDYKNSNPKRAANVVNKLMNLYLENDIATNRAEAESARSSMAKQLPDRKSVV